MSSNCRAGEDKLDARHGTAARVSVYCLKCHLQCITYKNETEETGGEIRKGALVLFVI